MKKFDDEKLNFDKMAAFVNLDNIFVYVCLASALVGRSTCTRAFDETIQILCIHNVDTLNICMKEIDCIKIIIDKITAVGTRQFF